jgi:hypothetical protein
VFGDRLGKGIRIAGFVAKIMDEGVEFLFKFCIIQRSKIVSFPFWRVGVC